jgi:hypothetical protein
MTAYGFYVPLEQSRDHIAKLPTGKSIISLILFVMMGDGHKWS